MLHCDGSPHGGAADADGWQLDEGRNEPTLSWSSQGTEQQVGRACGRSGGLLVCVDDRVHQTLGESSGKRGTHHPQEEGGTGMAHEVVLSARRCHCPRSI